jgi:hypothetical protein
MCFIVPREVYEKLMANQPKAEEGSTVRVYQYSHDPKKIDRDDEKRIIEVIARAMRRQRNF